MLFFCPFAPGVMTLCADKFYDSFGQSLREIHSDDVFCRKYCIKRGEMLRYLLCGYWIFAFALVSELSIACSDAIIPWCVNFRQYPGLDRLFHRSAPGTLGSGAKTVCIPLYHIMNCFSPKWPCEGSSALPESKDNNTFWPNVLTHEHVH